MGMNSLSRSPSKRTLCIIGAVVLLALTFLQFDHSLHYPSNWQEDGWRGKADNAHDSHVSDDALQPSLIHSSSPSEAVHPPRPSEDVSTRPADDVPRPRPGEEISIPPAAEDVPKPLPAEGAHDGPAADAIPPPPPEHDNQPPPEHVNPPPSADDDDGPRLGVIDEVHSHNIEDDIRNTTFGFEKIFIVGLPDRTDRRDGITLQASLSDMSIDFIDGVRGDAVPDKALPMLHPNARPPPAVVGSWRAHMNAIREVVQRNLSSALIMEDDVDWDIRIKGQMEDFGRSTRALIQPLTGEPGRFADPTFPHPHPDSPGAVGDIPFAHLPTTVQPNVSPYGDDWDVMWLGHCGVHFPFPDNPVIPKGRVVHTEDWTVPMKRYLWSIIQPFRLVEEYPEHTRAVHHTQEAVCTLAYAVSQRGARKLLADIGLREVNAAYDLLLRFSCDAPHMTCLTTQPGLFHHHRPAGPRSASSDIGNHEGWEENAGTDMVRWSVRLNAPALLAGSTEYFDGLPD